MDENTDRGDVEAKFVFTCGDATAEYTIKSTEKEVVIPEIEVTSDNPVELGNEGGAFDVTLATDTEGAELVAADFEVETSADWLTFNAPATGDATSATLNFTAEANTEEGAPARSADITVSYPGVENIIIKVNQAAGPDSGGQTGEDFVPYLKNHCISPELTIYTNANDKTMIESANWADPSVLSVGKTMTVEMLVKHDEVFQKKGDTDAKWDGTWVNCMFGIEGRFLIRQGDNSPDYPQQWELVWGASTEPTETKYRATKDLPGGEWVHIAIVADGSNVTLYQNGENVGGGEIPSHVFDIDFSTSFDGWEQGQAFALGRAYDNARDFVGKMAEVRIWNKALTADDIKAAGHFYSVPSDSDGLVAYWKLNEGEGDTFYDSTSNGNHLKGYYNTKAEDPVSYSATGKTGLNYWEFGVDWSSDLPEVPGFPRE